MVVMYDMLIDRRVARSAPESRMLLEFFYVWWNIWYTTELTKSYAYNYELNVFVGCLGE